MSDQSKLTLKVAQAEASAIGFTIKKTQHGDYKVIIKGDHDPEHGYFTTELQDALDTAKWQYAHNLPRQAGEPLTKGLVDSVGMKEAQS